METLLVVLVIGCALALAVHVGRGLWARARSVERHQQALDTLAGITHRPDVAPGSPTPPGTPGAGDELYEHQAHVRLIGPGGQSGSGDSSALPPPRATSALGPTSPFRRPSRSSPSAAALDAVATTAYLARTPGDKLVRTGTQPPSMRQPPGLPADATMPGLPPEQAPYTEPPTRPVPIVQPQVFYFDDMSSRGEAPGSAAQAAPSRSKLRRRDLRRARRQGAKADRFEGAVYSEAPDSGWAADPTVSLQSTAAAAVGTGAVDLSTRDTGPVDLRSGPPEAFAAGAFASQPAAYDPVATGPVFSGLSAVDAVTVIPKPAIPEPAIPEPAVVEPVTELVVPSAPPAAVAPMKPLVPEPAPPEAAGAVASVVGAASVAAAASVEASAPASSVRSAGSAAAPPIPAPGPSGARPATRTAPPKNKGPKNKGPKRTGRKSVVGVVLAAAAICVAVVAVGITLLGLPGQGSHNLAAGTTVPTSTKSHATSTSAPPATTTSPAPPKPAVLLSAAGGTATYELHSPSASIVVSATAPCWLEVRANSPLGQIIYEGILYAGQYSKVTGPAWIRLGNPPAVAVKVDGTLMAVPGAESAVPLNLQFTFG
jgi:Domain of unknown function (DUF4115)